MTDHIARERALSDLAEEDAAARTRADLMECGHSEEFLDGDSDQDGSFTVCLACRREARR